MISILGIDAAWTEIKTSGMALLHSDGKKWECDVVAPSCYSFIDYANGIKTKWSDKQKPGWPDIREILTASEKILNGEKVDIIAIDMPISTLPITGRRAADDEISKAYGNKGCAVHSPNIERPGKISDSLRSQFESHGFSLATKSTSPGIRKMPILMEVYPHTALLKLLNENYRIQYKITKLKKYWPSLHSSERKEKILLEWKKILNALNRVIKNIKLDIPGKDYLGSLKHFEDSLDALTCGWVGIEFLANRVTAYGDDTAAIWTP